MLILIPNLAVERLGGIHLSRNNLERVIFEAVDEGLSSLGDSPKQAIFFHLENSFKIRKERIPVNLTEFARALEKIFGPGARYLEKLIAKRLCEKLGLEFEATGDWDFLDYVDRVKKYSLLEGGFIDAEGE